MYIAYKRLILCLIVLVWIFRHNFSLEDGIDPVDYTFILLEFLVQCQDLIFSSIISHFLEYRYICSTEAVD